MCQTGFTTLSLERRGRHFYVEIDMLFTYEAMSKDDSKIITPVLRSEDQSMELPLMLVAGSRRYRAFHLALWGLRENIFRHYRIMKILRVVNQTSRNYLYRVKLDYEQWMDTAKINFI